MNAKLSERGCLEGNVGVIGYEAALVIVQDHHGATTKGEWCGGEFCAIENLVGSLWTGDSIGGVIESFCDGLLEFKLEGCGEIEGKTGADSSCAILNRLDGALCALGVLTGQRGNNADAVRAEGALEGEVDTICIAMESGDCMAVGIVPFLHHAVHGVEDGDSLLGEGAYDGDVARVLVHHSHLLREIVDIVRR